ncbi:MAG TPA: class I SAM-dependent methyltransferase, partial [Cyclobacteriaceae bacterium]|nr:class I SAM-dependent methyltransferase [Cyclobacteriaceae bacterium]
NIYKKELKDLDTKYDLIMFNHAFEHMHDHKNILQRVNQLLNDNGRVIIRVPVVNYAWEKYSTNWVQLDAPRHICVFSEKAITLLAKESDLEIEKIIYDSTAFQFWGSEQYKQNIPLRDPRSYAENPARSIFSTKQIIEYSKQAEKLNQEGKGDQACFILRKMIN